MPSEKAAKLGNVLTSLLALLRLAVLSRLGVFICALGVLLSAANTASALEPVQTKTRVWGFDFAEHNSVGLFRAATSGKHQGNRLAGAEEASGSLLAAEGAGSVAASDAGLAARLRPIKEFEVTTYRDFAKRSVVGDGLEGHEVLQHALLKDRGLATGRLSGTASRNNPVIALRRDPSHLAANAMQAGVDVSTESAIANIGRNSNDLLRLGVPRRNVYRLTNQAIAHARELGLIPK